MIELKKVRNLPDKSLTFKRKLDAFNFIQQEKNVYILLYLMIILIFGIIFNTFIVFRLEEYIFILNKQVELQKKDLHIIRHEQKKMIINLPIQTYPKGGIGLDKYKWEELFLKNNKKIQCAIENDLSSKMSPYFGLSNILIVMDIPTQTLNIVLTGDFNSGEYYEKIKYNVEMFLKEAEKITKIYQITFQTRTNEDEKRHNIYIFYRENLNDQFSFMKP